MTLGNIFLKFNPVKSVNVPVKLGLSAALSLLLVAYLLSQLVSIQTESIHFREAELHGTQFIPTLYKIVSHTQVTRGLTNSKLNGSVGLDDQITANRNAALEGYADLDRLVQTYGDLANLQASGVSLRRQFESLNSSAFNGNAAAVFSQYTSLIDELRGLIVAVGDASKLTLDPELDTFYLMDYLVFKAHATAESFGIMRGRGAGIIQSNNYSTATLVPLARFLGSANADATVTSLESAVAENSAIGASLNSLISDIRFAQDKFGEQVLTIVENGYASVGSGDFFAMGTDAISVLYRGVGIVNNQLQALLEERIAENTASRNLEMMIVVLVVLSSVYIFIATIVSIVVSLRRTQEVLSAISRNDFSKTLVVEGKDEFQELATSLNETQNILQTKIEQERKQAAETQTIKNALDVADTPVMMADNDMNIIYLNQSAKKMMDKRGETLKTALPSLDYRNLLGTNVDQFHKNPAHQRNLLADLTTSYQSEINVAGLTFSLTATPLLDAEGKRNGTVIEWKDLTDARAAENKLAVVAQENQRIKQALDNVSTNTMIADSNRTIVYINKSVHTMLKSRERAIQEVLPNFRADHLIGESMDVFHKNPAHQRGLLEGLNQTHRAQIQVADLHFGLTANPVYDENGERLGTVVEWEDRTNQVNIQMEVDALINAASHGDLSRRISLDGKEGFFASLSEGLNQLVEISEGVVADTARVFSALSHGDLTEEIHKQYDGAFGELKNDANATVNKLTEIITQIREAASTVSTGADEIAQGNADLSQRTEEQASSLEETASSMEEMTSAVKSSADNAVQANEIASQTQRLASSGGAVVENAVKAMAEINESSKHIADIIGVIDEIAFQTNLLALNAAVEAARAGEQGRGFAVVASEVRNLAQRSAGAAKEIKDLIRDSVDKVTTGSELVNRSGETLKEIVESVQKVSTMVEDISNSAKEQSSGIEQVNKAVSQMDEMTQQNAALVEEATAAGEAMAEQARKLMQQMAFFTLSHDKVSGTSSVSYAPQSHSVPKLTEAPAPVSQKKHQGGADVSDEDDDWEEF